MNRQTRQDRMGSPKALLVLVALVLLLSVDSARAFDSGNVMCYGFVHNCFDFHCQKPDPFALDFCEDARFKPLDEFVSQTSTDFFYTAGSWTIASQQNYLHVGQVAIVATTPLNGTELTTPLWRFYNAPHHFYTVDSKEAPAPLTLETAEGHVFVTKVPGSLELMRFKKGDLFRLALEYDRKELETKSWVYNKTLGYAYRPCTNTLLDPPIKENQWYQINLKSTGLLTWSSTKVYDDGYHLQIVWGTPAQDYLPGNQYNFDSHWKITPSEKPGYYNLTNRGLPNAPISWEGDAPSGKWVVALNASGTDPDYLPGGKYRDDTFWRFELDAEKCGQFYGIYNLGYPDNGMMTFSSEVQVAAGKQFVEILTGALDPATKVDKNYLWELIPAGQIK